MKRYPSFKWKKRATERPNAEARTTDKQRYPPVSCHESAMILLPVTGQPRSAYWWTGIGQIAGAALTVKLLKRVASQY
jgi:hypothetical protein